MKQFFHLRNAFFLFTLLISCSLLTGCFEKMASPGEEELDKYDSPDKAAEFQFNRTKNPYTGTVDRQAMWQAVLQTEQIKEQLRNSQNFTSALTWTERGSYTDAVGPSNGNTRPNNGVTSGRIRAVWVDLADATGKTVWIGGVDGGIWKTTDITASPATWTLANDFLSNLAVSGICQDPTNTNIMYFCTGESFFNGDAVFGNGVFKSTDHGVTWSQLPSTSTLTRCSKILCDAAGNVYVSTIGISVAVGLQRSSDGGNTWTSINPFTTTSRIVDFEISSTGRMHVSAGLFSASGIGGYRYTSNPATATTTTGWSTPTVPFSFPFGTAGARTELACRGNVVYAALAHPNASNNSSKIDSIAKSTDGGDTWTTIALSTTNVNDLNGSGSSAGQAWYCMALDIDPSDPNNVMVGSLNVLKSTDGGTTWNKISEWVGNTGQYVHADQHNITWYDNGNKLLVGCDGGIHFSTNKGTTFVDRNTNLRLKQFYSVAIHPSSTNYFLGGTQDNGTHQLNGPGLTSSVEVTGGDGAYVGIDQNEPLFQVGAYVFCNFRRSADGGATWSGNGNASSSGLFINPFDYDDVGNKVYASYNAGQYVRWENPQAGFTLTPIAVTAFNGAQVAAATVSPYTANRVYFGTTAGRVVQVDNAHTATPTEANITPAGMSGFVNSVIVGSSDQNLIATVTNTGVTNIWSSTNGGTSWVACDGNLPDIPVYWALFNPDDNTKVFIATETGVWSTDLLNGSGTVWVPETTFPTVKTMMLKFRSSDRLIAAATHGRGIWTATLPAGCTATTISSQPSNSAVCEGGTTSFTVAANGTPPVTYQWQLSTNGAGGPWNNVSNGGVYSGATSTTLTITGATIAMNTYQYRCAVTGNCTPATANSNPAILTVNAATAINTQPINSTICAGASTSFSVNAVGTAPLGYQWQLSTTGAGGPWNNITNGGVYSGATSATLTITGATIAMNTYQYRCVVTGGCAPLTLNSNPAILTVNAATVINTQPLNSSICAGNNAAFTVAAAGTSLTYQWQESTNGGGTWNNITNGGIYSNATTTTLNLTGVTAGMNNNQYRCVVTGTCGTLNSTAAVLSVNTAPAITGQPADIISCSGNIATFSVTATGSSVTYQWQESTNGGGTWNNLTNVAPYSGVTSATLTISPTAVGMNNNQYRCIVTGVCPPTPLTSNAATLTVGAAMSVTAQPSNASACAGLNAGFSITTSGTVLGYQWQESTNGGGTWNNITNGGVYSGATTASLTLTGVTAGMNNYQYRCVINGNCPSINSNAALLSVTTAAAITSQPTASTICAAQNSSFSVTASGSSLTYQWQVSTTGCGGPWSNVVNGAPYAGATSATLTITGATTAMNGYAYQCVVTGICAPLSVTSNCALLTVNTPVGITGQPAASAVCAGLNASFNVTATGTGLTYQWQESTNGGGTWNNITNGGIYSGATSATLTLTGVTAGMNNNLYRCVVSGAAGCASSNSNAAVLTVNTAPNITGQPLNSTICVSQTTSFNVTANGTGLSYQWQESVTGCGGPWANVTNGGVYSGATSATLTITGAPTTMNGYGYRCVITGSCAPAATSNCGLLTVNTAVNISGQPVASIICAGQNTSYSVTASGSGLTYQWQESTNGGGTWNNITNGGIYSGATSATLTLTGVTAGMNNNQYRCIVSGGAGCSSATTVAATLTVNTAPNISAQPVNSTICATQSTTFSVTASGTGISYQWQESVSGCAGPWVNVNNGGIYSGATTSILTLTAAPATMNGYAYRCIITGTCSPAATSNCAQLTVNTPVNITAQPANSTVCAGTNTTFSVTVTGTSPTYQWQESTNGGGTWTNIVNGGIYGGATTNTLSLTGITAGMNNNQYRCVVGAAAACASANSNGATLTVNTAPSITTQPVAGAAVCAGQIKTYSIVANGTGLTYQWQESTNGGTTWNNLTNTAPYSGVNTAALTINPTTVAMNSYQYRCIISGTCNPAATSGAVALTVFTPISITTAPADAAICATGTTSFTAAAAGTTPAYQWQESTNGGATWANINNGGIYSGATTGTLTLTGVTAGMNGYRYRAAVSGAAPCSSLNTVSALLTVNAQPTVTLSASPYTKLLPGRTTVITASVNPAVPFTAVWTWNGNAITPVGNTYTADVNHLGTYTVVATIGSCTSVPGTIVIGDSASSKLWIYPNPSTGVFWVSYYVPGASSSNATTQNLTIYGSDGRLVYSKKLTIIQPYQLEQVDMRRNGDDVYYVVLRDASGKKIKTGQVVVRR